MSRIDQALRRSNVDAARGTGAPAPPPEPAPWAFEEPENAVHHPEECPEDSASALGEVTESPSSSSFPTLSERFVVSKEAGPLLVEQFRSLAATLNQAQNDQNVRTLVVTSASPGDGKSFVAVNLALTLSESYRRSVLLIDADLRRPSLHDVFGVSNSGGLSAALEATTEEKIAAIRVAGSLALVPAGRPDPDPLGGLSSGRMKRIIDEAAARFDWVIVDTPPVGVLADGRIVSEMVDRAIFVVRAGVTRFADVEGAIDVVGADRVAGIVLNAVDPLEIHGKDYYSHYYGCAKVAGAGPD